MSPNSPLSWPKWWCFISPWPRTGGGKLGIMLVGDAKVYCVCVIQSIILLYSTLPSLVLALIHHTAAERSQVMTLGTKALQCWRNQPLILKVLLALPSPWPNFPKRPRWWGGWGGGWLDQPPVESEGRNIKMLPCSALQDSLAPADSRAPMKVSVPLD